LSRDLAQLDRLITSLLEDRRAAGRLRQLTPVQALDATHVQIGDRQFVNFCSNNYLGLSRHPRIIAAVESALRETGWGSGAAGLICGHTPLHESAQRALVKWKQTEAAILLPSGYQANHAAVQTLAALSTDQKRIRFLVDKLAHASILDACFADGLSVRVFPHNNLAKLARLLESGEGQDVVVTESIFSMDGDATDLAGLVQLKQKHPFILFLDEAHASGIYGAAGAGYAQELGLGEAVDISIVTLSKALGGIGGAICASRSFCDAVVNFGRAYIYSTSIPPAAAAAAEAAIGILRDEPELGRRVRDLAARVRRELTEAGIAIPNGDSPIVPIILGGEEQTLDAARNLHAQGLWVIAVRPPTVKPGSSRLRVTLSAKHTDEEVDRLIEAVKKIWRRARRTD
jgi:8-amino-7-oxononanoate synthase